VPPNFHGNPPEGAAHTATAYTALVDRTVADMAGVLGRDADARKYRDHEATVTAALNAKFLDRTAGIYTTEKPAGYRQTASILPLAMGLTPAAEQDRVFANLVADLHRKNDHLDTGILGTRYLLPLLTARGESDLAYTVATQTTFPSWGYFVGKGATSLWEMWDDGARSRDHHMFGSIGQWFYEDLAGIKPTGPAYRTFDVTPHAPGDLTAASARLDTVRGEAASSWHKRRDGNFTLDVTVPVGSTATVSIPAASRSAVTEGGRRNAEGVTFLRYAGGRAVFSVGSGEYRFRAG